MNKSKIETIKLSKKDAEVFAQSYLEDRLESLVNENLDLKSRLAQCGDIIIRLENKLQVLEDDMEYQERFNNGCRS